MPSNVEKVRPAELPRQVNGSVADKAFNTGFVVGRWWTMPSGQTRDCVDLHFGNQIVPSTKEIEMVFKEAGRDKPGVWDRAEAEFRVRLKTCSALPDETSWAQASWQKGYPQK